MRKVIKAKKITDIQPKTVNLIEKYGDVTLEFKKWVKEFMDEHDDALRELAKR